MTPADAIALLRNRAASLRDQSERCAEAWDMPRSIELRDKCIATLECALLIQDAYNASLAQGVPQPVQFRNLDEEGKCLKTY